MSRAKTFVKKIFRFAGIELKKYNQSLPLYKNLFDKYHTFTMIPEQLFISNLELCDQYRHLQGDYVECGVWRGGMSAAISEILASDKTIHLFDSFEGLPPAKEIDGKEALAWQQDVNALGYFDNCRAEESYTIHAMSLAGKKNYKIYKGWFNQTLPNFKNQPISILRLDGDWYDSIIKCLDKLFPHVVDGGIVMLDDYYAWDGCAKAVHDYLSETKSPSRLYQWDNQIAYIVKKKSEQ